MTRSVLALVSHRATRNADREARTGRRGNAVYSFDLQLRATPKPVGFFDI